MSHITKDILFIINPKAGTKQKDLKSQILSFSIYNEIKFHFYQLKGKNDSENIDIEIAKIKPDIVVAVGGDGTISLIARKLYNSQIIVGIIPTGSANGLAKELGIDEDINAALKIIISGEVKTIDSLTVNGLPCLHLSDIGLNARLIKYFGEGNIRGKWGYVRVAFRLLFRTRIMKVCIENVGQKKNFEALMVVIANASKYGTGAVINPKGDIADGLFELVIIKKMSILTLYKMWFNPMSLSPNHTEIIRTNEAIVVTEKKMHFQVDGEYIGKVQRVYAKINSSKLRIMVPKIEVI